MCDYVFSLIERITNQFMKNQHSFKDILADGTERTDSMQLKGHISSECPWTGNGLREQLAANMNDFLCKGKDGSESTVKPWKADPRALEKHSQAVRLSHVLETGNMCPGGFQKYYESVTLHPIFIWNGNICSSHPSPEPPLYVGCRVGRQLLFSAQRSQTKRNRTEGAVYTQRASYVCGLDLDPQLFKLGPESDPTNI